VIAVNSLSAELSSITPDALASDDNHILLENAPRFWVFFKRLKVLLSDNKEVREDLVSTTEQLTVEGSNSPPPSRRGHLIVAPDSPPLSHPLEFSVPHPSESSSLRTSKKRPNSLTLTSTSPLKVRNTAPGHSNMPHTPDRPTIPADPDYSGDSIESTDEDNTKHMITTFVLLTLVCLERGFNNVPWPLHTGKCSLETSGSSISSSLC
jgi:hypothetical protein